MKISKKTSKAGARQAPRRALSSSRAGPAENNDFDLLEGDGFRLQIPKAYSKNIKTGDDKQWEYGEFFSAFQDDQKSAEMEGVFYYWTKDKRTRFNAQAIRKLCRQVVKDHLFEAGLRLKIKDSFETKFDGFPAMVLRCRYEFETYQASGPLHLFVVDNLAQKKLFVLGVLTERSSDYWREAQSIQFLEDAVVVSFEFC